MNTDEALLDETVDNRIFFPVNINTALKGILVIFSWGL